jgi:putative ABC transport system permease protein
MSVSRQRATLGARTVHRMITATLRDLQWRARRFVIAGLGASMIFALTLVFAGLEHSFASEAGRVVDGIGADTWVVTPGVHGVFMTVSVLPESLAAQVAKEPGVTRADPILVLHNTVLLPAVTEINLVGYNPGGLGTPHVSRGRLPRRDGELVADVSLGTRLGSTVPVAGKEFTVVGITHGLTINGGQPVAFLRLPDAQRLLVRGAHVASAIVTKGVPQTLPAGYVGRSRHETQLDLLRPLNGAIASLKLTLVLLWGVAALVIGSVVYLSALERRRDFAVYKATGWSTRSLALGLALQAVLLSTTASLLGLVVAQLLIPAFPLVFDVPMGARLLLPAVGLLVGLIASAAGLRKAVGVEPALAFGGP